MKLSVPLLVRFLSLSLFFFAGCGGEGSSSYRQTTPSFL